MDKFMGRLMEIVRGGVEAWRNLVKLPTTTHVVAGKQFSVDWAMVAMVVAFWASMVLVDWLLF